jgi:hypothetical protein
MLLSTIIFRWRASTASCAIASALMFVARLAEAGPAVGQFEIKTLGAEPGAVEWQSQNDFSFGNPRRHIITNAGGDLLADDNTITKQRSALEGEFGLSDFLKARVGIGFVRERFDDPRVVSDANRFSELTFEGFGFETNWTIVRRRGDGFGIGVLFEYDRPIVKAESQTITTGVLVEWANGPWTLAVHPMLTRYFRGGSADDGGAGDKLDFGYAMRVMYTYSDELAVAVEAYGSIERVGNSGPRDDSALAFGDVNQHRIGPIVYWSIESDDSGGLAQTEKHDPSKVQTTLGFGAFLGLNKDTPDTTLKFSVEVAY